MVSTDDFRAELHAQLCRAERRGAAHVEINSGELHRAVGGYPGSSHRMPVCCDAMYAEQRAGDEVVMRPAKGKGASLTIRYALPRPAAAKEGPDRTALVVQPPALDAKGFPVWNDELEAAHVTHPAPKGWLALAFQDDSGWHPILVGGWLIQGAERPWVARAIVLPAEGGALKYAFLFQFEGEDRALPNGGMKMYPRLPLAERATGILSSASLDDVTTELDTRLAILDQNAELIYQQVVQKMEKDNAEQLHQLGLRAMQKDGLLTRILKALR